MCIDCRRLDDKEWITVFFKTVHEQQSHHNQANPSYRALLLCYPDSFRGSLLALGFHPELSWQYTVKYHVLLLLCCIVYGIDFGKDNSS